MQFKQCLGGVHLVLSHRTDVWSLLVAAAILAGVARAETDGSLKVSEIQPNLGKIEPNPIKPPVSKRNSATLDRESNGIPLITGNPYQPKLSESNSIKDWTPRVAKAPASQVQNQSKPVDKVAEIDLKPQSKAPREKLALDAATQEVVPNVSRKLPPQTDSNAGKSAAGSSKKSLSWQTPKIDEYISRTHKDEHQNPVSNADSFTGDAALPKAPTVAPKDMTTNSPLVDIEVIAPRSDADQTSTMIQGNLSPSNGTASVTTDRAAEHLDRKDSPPSNRSAAPLDRPMKGFDGDRGDNLSQPERSSPDEIAVETPDSDVEVPADGSAGEQKQRLPTLSSPNKTLDKSLEKNQSHPALILRAPVARMKASIGNCLRYYYARPEDMAGRSPWGTFHSILPFGVDAKVVSNDRTYNGIAWLAGNNTCRGQQMLAQDAQKAIKALEGVGLQGHQAQFLAILGQCGVPIDYPLYVSRRKYSVADLVRTEQSTCQEGKELTFSLIGLSSYLTTDMRWRAADGTTWDFERLIAEELKQPVVGAACGGTHRMMGFSYSLHQRHLEGQPITGQWQRSQVYIQDFTEYAWSLQNRDGSFSTDWFEGRADSGDLDRKLQTSGHILEWLVYSSPRDGLQSDRMIRAVDFALRTLVEGRTRGFEVGPKNHALRALALYHERVFDDPRPWLPATRVSKAGSPRR